MDDDIYSLRENQYIYSSPCEFKVVEVNPVESCTRRCSFCPRSDSSKYPNRRDRISKDTCINLAKQLRDLRFDNRLGFVGFGEPLMHSNLEECISVIRKYIPTMKWLEINTNGDLLSRARIKSLYESGCNLITVSMYDQDISDKIESLKEDIPIQITYRHHYDSLNNYNLNLVNRKDIAFENIPLNLKTPCYIPFYSLMIDWNGDVLPCANDWSRTVKFGNINKDTITDILIGKVSMEFKKSLSSGVRTQAPCSKCNVCGTLRGEKEYNDFKRRYNV
jgi:radical SAM protein with 4Fe4S-binding SPASM domain